MMKKSFNLLNWKIACIAMIFMSFSFTQEGLAKTKHPLVGVWKMESKNGDQPVVCYKLLKKDGSYVNLRSTTYDPDYFFVTRQGKFFPGAGEYIERLVIEHGRECDPPVNFPLKYEFTNNSTLHISFRLGDQNYDEVWHKVKKAPKY